jgi:hypothetical protein
MVYIKNLPASVGIVLLRRRLIALRMGVLRFAAGRLAAREQQNRLQARLAAALRHVSRD